jgi:hypothetical protein
MKRSWLLLACSLLAACSSTADVPAISPADAGGGDPGAAAASGAGPSGNASGNPGAGPAAGADSGAAPSPAPADDAGAPPANDDAGSAPTDDAGSGGGAGSGTGVFGGDAGAYVATLGPSADNDKHPQDANPAGLACLSCHGGQKPNITRFLFAGTVWTSAAATTPAAQVEVRVVGADGSALSAYSDANGNFFFLAGNDPLSAPAHAGVRDAQGAANMNNVFNVGDCNSCHRSGGQAPIHAP